MPRLALSVAHQLGRVEAKRRIGKLLDKFRSQGGVWSQRWSADSLLFLEGQINGHAVTADVSVQDASVDATLTVPWSLALFADRIQRTVEQSARQVLNEP